VRMMIVVKLWRLLSPSSQLRRRRARSLAQTHT